MATLTGRTRAALRLFGVDRAIAFTLLSRGWTAISGFLTLFLLTRFLSPVQQGFYYTFASVLSLQIFFELGLAYVILQFASHERASLEWTPEGTLTGDPRAKARMASLLRLAMLWYGVITVLFVALVLPAGLLFFGSHAPAGVQVAWRLPWVAIVLVTAGTLAVSPIFAIIEGCGLVSQVASVQAAQNIASSVLLWLALCLHGALLSSPLSSLAALLWGVGWLWLVKRGFLRDLFQSGRAATEAIGWREEIWPFQWKIAVSWLSGYFIFQLFNPMLFAFHGPVAAGQMGLSLTIVNTISALAISWVATKAAPFGSFVARRDFAGMDRVFFPCLWQSLTVLVLGGLALWIAVWYLGHVHAPLSRRLLGPEPLALLVGAVILTHVISAEAIYLRAHKQEPFLLLSLFIGGLVALACFFLGRPFAATGMMAGYFLINLTVGLGGGTWLFLQKRRLWHAPLAFEGR